MVDNMSATAKKRCREEAVEQEEAEKEKALIEAALMPAKRPSFNRLSSSDSLLVEDVSPVQPPRPRSLEEAMKAHTLKLKLEQMQREEDEREAMAEEMRKIAELERQAEEIEFAAKAFEQRRIEQLEREAVAFERAAVAYESKEYSPADMCSSTSSGSSSSEVSFAVGPRWNVSAAAPRKTTTVPPPRRFPRSPWFLISTSNNNINDRNY